jgi:large subunit ribosomal protein L25
MPDYVKLSAEPRTVLGKKVKRLRREGKLPAVLYGPVVEEAVSITVDRREFDTAYKRVGATSLIELSVNGQSQPVFVREVQTHPVRREILHIDFYAPNMTLPVDASVPITLVGQLGEEVEAELTHGLFEITVRALPDQIPNQVEVDISGLKEIGDSIMVADLVVPENVTIVTSDDDLIAKLDPIREEEIEEEPEEALAEELGDEAQAVAEAADAEEAAESEDRGDGEDEFDKDL